MALVPEAILEKLEPMQGRRHRLHYFSLELLYRHAIERIVDVSNAHA